MWKSGSTWGRRRMKAAMEFDGVAGFEGVVVGGLGGLGLGS